MNNPQEATMNLTNDEVLELAKEREAFETWALTYGYFDEVDDSGTSTINFDESKWEGWQARAQLNTKPTNTDEWVRVPIEPTEEMWVAGSSAYRNGNRLASPVSRIYKAMINAISQDKGESV